MEKETLAARREADSIFVLAEAGANLFNLKCIAVLAALALIAAVLNMFGLFSLQREIMLSGVVLADVIFFVPLSLFVVNDKIRRADSVLKKPYFRHVVVSTAFFGIGTICILLSFHTTILVVIPPLIASQYRNTKKQEWLVMIASLLLIFITVYGSFFFGAPDRNFIKGMLTDEEAKSFAMRLTIATPKRMTELFWHYVLPQLLSVFAVVLMATGISRRSSKMLDKEMELSGKVQEEMERRHEIQSHVIEVLANLIETRDVSTGTHILNTKKYVRMIASAMQNSEKYRGVFSGTAIEMLTSAAPLHDVGKIVVPDTILLKPARLTPEEFEKMKTHAAAGGDLIRQFFAELDDAAFLRMAEEIAVAHHEKWDGSGYPRGLKGEEIPLSARIMAIADVFDALVSVRVYKGSISPEKALEILYEESGTHFDPDLIEIVRGIEAEFIAAAQNKKE